MNFALPPAENEAGIWGAGYGGLLGEAGDDAVVFAADFFEGDDYWV